MYCVVYSGMFVCLHLVAPLTDRSEQPSWCAPKGDNMHTTTEEGTDGVLPTKVALDAIRAVQSKAEELVSETLLSHAAELQAIAALVRAENEPRKGSEFSEGILMAAVALEAEVRWLRNTVLAFRRPAGHS